MRLDLGEALIAFGLIFTVYQLRTPRWEIVLSVRDAWQRNLVWIRSNAVSTLRALFFKESVTATQRRARDGSVPADRAKTFG